MSHSPFPWSTHPQVPHGVYDADGMKAAIAVGPNAEDNAALIAAIPAMVKALQTSLTAMTLASGFEVISIEFEFRHAIDAARAALQKAKQGDKQ